MEPDENNGQGGSYVIQDGSRVLIERTQDAPNGNGPRLADDAPAAVPEQSPAAPDQLVTDTPAEKTGKGKPQTTEGGNE